MEKCKILISKKLQSDMYLQLHMYSCETVWVKMLVPKDACSQKLKYKHNNGKKQMGKRGRIKNMEFSGVK